MKLIIACLLFLFPFLSWTQYLTTSIKIHGSIVPDRIINLDSLRTHRPALLRNFPIVNKKGEIKYVIKEAKGVPLLNLFNGIEFKADRPKDVDGYVLLFKAIDGLQVSFSYNELFNNPLGETVYLLYEIDGKKIDDAMGGSFILYCASDKYSGKRFVKWLSEIKIIKIIN